MSLSHFEKNIRCVLSGYKATGRNISENQFGFELRETVSAYNDLFGTEKEGLRPKNGFIFGEDSCNTDSWLGPTRIWNN